MKELKKYFGVHLYIQTLSNCHASLVCKPWCLSRKKILRSQLIFSRAGKAVKGAVTFPRMTTYGEDSRLGHFSFHFLKGKQDTQGSVYTYRQARGTHINVKKKTQSEIFMPWDL